MNLHPPHPSKVYDCARETLPQNRVPPDEQLNARLTLTAGPSMPAMAARIITEAKAGRKSSTDVHLGPPATHADLHNEKLLERVNYAKIFPWVTKEMEILSGDTVLVYTSLQG